MLTKTVDLSMELTTARVLEFPEVPKSDTSNILRDQSTNFNSRSTNAKEFKIPVLIRPSSDSDVTQKDGSVIMEDVDSAFC